MVIVLITTRLAPNGTYYLGRFKFERKMILKYPRFVPVVANLAQLKSKSDIPDHNCMIV